MKQKKILELKNERLGDEPLTDRLRNRAVLVSKEEVERKLNKMFPGTARLEELSLQLSTGKSPNSPGAPRIEITTKRYSLFICIILSPLTMDELRLPKLKQPVESIEEKPEFDERGSRGGKRRSTLKREDAEAAREVVKAIAPAEGAKEDSPPSNFKRFESQATMKFKEQIRTFEAEALGAPAAEADQWIE